MPRRPKLFIVNALLWTLCACHGTTPAFDGASSSTPVPDGGAHLAGDTADGELDAGVNPKGDVLDSGCDASATTPPSDGGSSVAENGGDSGTLPPQICDEPAPWPTPALHVTIGTGTAASCTADAVRNAASKGAYVTFDCGMAAATLAVPTEIEVSADTVFDGENKITLDGGGASRIFSVDSGHSLSVRRLRFVNGKAPASTDADGIGGAIAGQWKSKVEVRESVFEDNTAGRGGGAVSVWTASTLTIVRSQFFRNHSWYGGAVYSLLSPLSISNSLFESNATLDEGEGGAIGTDGASDSPDDGIGGAVSLCGTKLFNNSSRGAGGAAFLWVYPPDTITIDRSTLQGNTVKANASGIGAGGGLRASNGLITIEASSFLSNTAETHGGGLWLDCSPSCSIINSTFDSNRCAPSDGSASGYGGAIFGNGFKARNVTIARNYAGGHGGALFGGSNFELHDALLVDNSAGNPWNQAMSCADTGSGDHVMQWEAKSGTSCTDPCIPGVTAIDPKLDPAPADHGGPSPTLLLGAGSPALQVGTSCETTDQRGLSRDPSHCDLGAVEMP